MIETLEISPLRCLANLSPANHRLEIENLIAAVAENAAKRQDEG